MSENNKKKKTENVRKTAGAKYLRHLIKARESFLIT